MKVKKPLKFFYKNHISLNGNICLYCGQHATTLDHIPALTMAKLYPDIEKIVVRCCLLCNILISNRPLNSIKERAEFLYFKYPVKYKALLSLPDWSDEELDELSGYLRLKITKEIKKKRIFEDKLKFLQNFIITFAND